MGTKMGRKLLRSLDLFSGIGGLTVALRGVAEPVAYCDIDWLLVKDLAWRGASLLLRTWGRPSSDVDGSVWRTKAVLRLLPRCSVQTGTGPSPDAGQRSPHTAPPVLEGRPSHLSARSSCAV